MPPLHTRATVSGSLASPLLKVLGIDEALRGGFPFDRVAIDLRPDGPEVDAAALAELGFAAVIRREAGEPKGIAVLHGLADPEVVAPGDVVRVHAGSGRVSVLFRRGGNANALLLTGRCDSRCLMCSQPPVERDDGGGVAELLELIPLIDPDLEQLGLTGGEPTLLGAEALSEIIAACRTALPDTRLHILTNGRNFSYAALADAVVSAAGQAVWGIPLHADVSWLHDFVAQARGAFDQTVNGIYTLAERGHAVEIRFVVHARNAARMERFAEFVYRTMPFAAHVAFMGLEPMGFARVNRHLVWIDPLDYAPALARAAGHLRDRGLAVSIYNVQLCVLPRAAWPLARQSVSDWKTIYDLACRDCAMRQHCCGFFASTDAAWRSRGIQAITEEEAVR